MCNVVLVIGILVVSGVMLDVLIGVIVILFIVGVMVIDLGMVV